MSMPAYEPAKKRDSLSAVLLSVIVIFALCLTGSVVSALVADDGNGTESAIVTGPPAATAPSFETPGRIVGSAAAAAAAKPRPVTIGKGQWTVPGEIKPGTYTTTASEDGFGCYWARVKSFDGELRSIIANDIVAAGARGRFTIKPTDRGVELTGECVWTKR